jgi:hypothetical protein
MTGPNVSLVMLRMPHIAAQLRALPRTSRDRQAIVDAIELLSHDSLLVADKLMEMVEQRRSAKITNGMKAARRRGVQCGRQKVAFDRDRALQLHLQGKSIRQIATLLRVHRDTVARLLRPPTAPS